MIFDPKDQSIIKLVYVQGMNVIAGAFLYVFPELEAFFSVMKFLKCCPLYWTKGIEGAYQGLELLDEILRVTDPELFLVLSKANHEGLALQYILSFSGATPPLSELLILWDFFIAFGVHLNVISVASQIILARDQILNSDRPTHILK